MNKAKDFISKLLYNKFFWQLIFSAFLIGTSVFFIRHENVELFRIREQLRLSNSWYVLDRYSTYRSIYGFSGTDVYSQLSGDGY